MLSGDYTEWPSVTGWTTCGTTCRALWPVTFVPMLRRHSSHLQSASTSDGECREGRECRECVEKCDIHAQRYQSKGPVNVVNVLRKYFARGALILPNRKGEQDDLHVLLLLRIRWLREHRNRRHSLRVGRLHRELFCEEGNAVASGFGVERMRSLIHFEL